MSGGPQTSRFFVLVRRPEGAMTGDELELREDVVAEPEEGEVLVRTLYLSIDPANRVWINEWPSYRPPVKLGAVMDGFALAEVVRSNDPRFSPGDLVDGNIGWAEYRCVPGKRLAPVERREPLSHRVSVLGITGLTAYLGLFEIGKPRTGETVLVSAAAGSVGSLAGQMARLHGCRVVGIAGTGDKCTWLTSGLGFEAAINYRTDDVEAAVDRHCPDGVDVYFDNVGGPLLDTVLARMRMHGRIVCCGAISQYDRVPGGPGIRGVPGYLIGRRLRMEGFIVTDLYGKRAAGEQQICTWLDAGELVVREQIIDGLEHAPSALMGLLRGENVGKRMIRVAGPA